MKIYLKKELGITGHKVRKLYKTHNLTPMGEKRNYDNNKTS